MKKIEIRQEVIQSWYGRYEDGVPLRGDDLLKFVLQEGGDTILLSFSAGKDSLAMWLYLREKGMFNIIPYYLFWVPGLSFVERALDYYEDYFQTHIIRMPHPLFYEYLTNFYFQPPERVAIIRSLRLPTFDYADVDDILAHHFGLKRPFTAVGIRYYDNMQRRWLIEQQGAVGNKRRRFFYPIWDWNIADVSEIIKRYGVKLSPEYGIIGRTLAAFDYQYLKPIKEHFPEDYETIKHWFPLIDLELFRYEVVGHGKNQAP